MRRGGPLQRRTPLRNKTGLQGHRIDPHRSRASEPDPGPSFDFAAAGAALRRAQESTSPEFSGPVETSKATPKPRTTGFPAVVRQTILDRDDHRCVACGVHVESSPVGYSLQHRDNRAMGGTRDERINLPANGLTLCGSGTTGCHGHYEANPELAERFGYAVASWADPESVPVLTHDGWMLLSNLGNAWATATPPRSDAHEVARRKAVRR